MKYKHRLASAITAAAVCALVCGFSAFTAWAEDGKSSCITCHLDENMLLANLAEVKVAKSAKQAGAG